MVTDKDDHIWVFKPSAGHHPDESGQRQLRHAQTVAKPRRQYWNSIPRAILSRAGEARATCLAGRLKE